MQIKMAKNANKNASKIVKNANKNVNKIVKNANKNGFGGLSSTFMKVLVFFTVVLHSTGQSLHP